MIKNLVTIYIPNHNYEKYIEKAIKSCLNQTYKHIEILIFDDGSKDKSIEVINRYSTDPRITTIYQKKIGLVKTCNKALYNCNGEYILRLDADDWLDENAITLLVDKLKKNPKSNFIFPDYYEVDQHGLITKLVRRHDFKNVSLKDQFAHGACTLFRVLALKKVGGYDETFTCQDGVNMWFKFLKKNQPLNINLPLFYYRKHSISLTTNYKKINLTRNKILKANAIDKKNDHSVGVIFARGKIFDKYSIFLKKVGSKSLLEITILRLERISKIKKIILCSPDLSLKKLTLNRKFKKTIFVERPAKLASPNVSIQDSLSLCIKYYEKKYKKKISTIVISKIASPFLDPLHIENALNTCKIFNLDSVIGIKFIENNLFRHNGKTLSPLRHLDSNFDNESSVKILIEPQQIYSQTGSFLVIKKNKIDKIDNLKSLKIGHEIIGEISSFEVRNHLQLKIANLINSKKKLII